jgi:hypothetical protein
MTQIRTTLSGRRIHVTTAEPQLVPSGHRRCRHVGEPIGETACKTCNGESNVTTRRCELHGVPCVTAMRQPAGDVRWCLRCDDHEPG